MIKISIKISVMVVFLYLVCLAIEKMLGFRDQCFKVQPITDLVLFILMGFVFSSGFKSFRNFNIRKKTDFSKFLFLGLTATFIILMFQPMILWIQEHFLDPKFYETMAIDWAKDPSNIEFIKHQSGKTPTDLQMIQEAKSIYNHNHQLKLNGIKIVFAGLTYSTGIGYFSYRKHFGN